MPTVTHMEISDESPLITSPVEHSTPKENSLQGTPLKQRSPDTQEGTPSQGTEGTTKMQE